MKGELPFKVDQRSGAVPGAGREFRVDRLAEAESAILSGYFGQSLAELLAHFLPSGEPASGPITLGELPQRVLLKGGREKVLR